MREGGQGRQRIMRKGVNGWRKEAEKKGSEKYGLSSFKSPKWAGNERNKDRGQGQGHHLIFSWSRENLEERTSIRLPGCLWYPGQKSLHLLFMEIKYLCKYTYYLQRPLPLMPFPFKGMEGFVVHDDVSKHMELLPKQWFFIHINTEGAKLFSKRTRYIAEVLSLLTLGFAIWPLWDAENK